MKLQTILFTIVLAVLFTGLCAQAPSIVVAADPAVISSGDSGVIRVTYALPDGYHMAKQEDYVYFNVEAPEGFTFEPIVYPEGQKDEWGDELYYGEAMLERAFTIGPNVKPGTYRLTVTSAWQICDESSCLEPDEAQYTVSVEVQGNAGGAVWNIIKFLLMAFAGGVILNIMPCVLPVLSIKAMHLVNQAHQDRREIMKGGLIYTAGILVSFVVLAGVVIVLTSLGLGAGWGFQMQNLTFVLAFASLVFVFALSLFDVFIISPPGMTMATKAGAKGGHAGSFFSGVFAVLLATPCTAPLLAPALGFAFTQPPAVILPFFLLIGLGLALPFILLAFWPGVIRKLPKPGEWMNVFREAMAFLLLATAVWLLTIAHALVGSAGFLHILWFMLFLGLAAWIYGRFARPHHGRAQQWIALLVAVAVIVGSALWLLRFPQDEAAKEGNIPAGWQAFSPELLQQLRDEGKPVFVDFGAEWCLTCKTNENAVLLTSDVMAEFREQGVELLKADNTRKDPVIGEWLKKYNRAGVPLYLLYYPGQDTPFVFNEVITKGDIFGALDKLETEGEVE